MSKLLMSLTGPVAVLSSVAFAYVANHPTAAQVERNEAFYFPFSTLAYCGLVFAFYLSGAMPPNPFFPRFVFRSNIFPLLYKVYCTYNVGYRILSGFMHQPVAYPHSDYRNGIRCLDAGSPLPVQPAPQGLQAEPAYVKQFYARGGGVVETALWAGSVDRGVVVMPVPEFTDNYAYLIISLQTKKVAVVDPADPEMVLRFLSSMRAHLRVPLQLTDVLTTHKHWDHAGGNQLLAEYAKKQPQQPQQPEEAAEDGDPQAVQVPLVSPDLRIIGSDVDRPLACTMFVNDASPVFQVAGGGVAVQAMAAPGHTTGSLVFVVGSADPAAAEATPARVAAFTGDSLFCGGCGAPFETATVRQIMKARETFLEDPRMRTQPATGQPVAEEDVLLYVGHEYTERLLQEVVTLMTRVVSTSKEAVDPRAKRFIRAAGEALRGVHVLRQASDGLKDAAMVGQDKSQGKPEHRLPSCTVPSSLALEKTVNPLLTVDDEELAMLAEAEKDGGMDSEAVERAIYCSQRRCMPMGEPSK